MIQVDFHGRLVPAILDSDRRCLRCGDQAPATDEAGQACEPCVLREVARLAGEVVLRPRTWRNYRNAWRAWEAWCVRRQVSPEVLSDAEVAAFLLSRRTEGIGARTVELEFACLRALCTHGGRTVEVGPMIKGLRRRLSREAEDTPLHHARPLRAEDLTAICCRMEKAGISRLQRLRDVALVTFGWSIAGRPDDLHRLRWSNLDFARDYITVHVPRAKTSPRLVYVVRARVIERCPVTAMERWKSACCARNDGPVFVKVDRYGTRSHAPLTAQSIGEIVASNALEAGLGDGFGGGSLRAGFVSAATEAGIETRDIQAVTDHKTERALNRYRRNIAEFRNPALKML